MSGILNGLQPERVFNYFEAVTKIPRCSMREKQVSDYLYHWANERNLEVIQDEAFNILIKKPGTAGYEASPTVILQGHLDMVCEKNMDTVHDFLKDPLKLRIVGDDIYASGTTLGADNGIAVAYVMALLDSAELPHPPLEVMLTTNEETGMTGVQNLDCTSLKGRILMNLDSGEEGIFTVGCAGGGRVDFFIPVGQTAPQFRSFYKLTLKGLQGGHSGTDIDKERGNAIKLLGRILYDLNDRMELAALAGGSKSNAIPRESWAVIAVGSAVDLPDFVNKWNNILHHELFFSDPGVRVTLERTDVAAAVYDRATRERVIHLINQIPDGPLSRDLERDIVVSSNNPGILTADADKITLTCAPRSSIKSLLNHFIDLAGEIAKILEIRVSVSSLYPAWEYAKESKIRDLCLETFADLFGAQGKVSVIHAGLECGFLAEKIPGLDAVSLGPNMFDIHSPNEHLSISSTRRTFAFLCEVLKRMK